MEKIKIITDSTADVPAELLKEYDVEVLPLIIGFDDESFLDGVEITLPTMLRRIEKTNKLPKTSQITPTRLAKCYKKYVDEGYKIISIHLSSEMSGTCQSAFIAKQQFEDADIRVIDGRNVTSGLGLIVLKAATMVRDGKNIDEIETELIEYRKHIKSALGFESLENLVRGGRLSKTKGVISSVLGIKLILNIQDGKMNVLEKVRGSKKAVKKIIEKFSETKLKEGEPVVLLKIENKDIYEPLQEYLKENNIDYIDADVGCTVGIHSGPKACGLFFVEEY